MARLPESIQMRARNQRHPWLPLSDTELLHIAGLYAESSTPDNLASHPKNPSICKFMIQLGRFGELGSGVINIHKYLPHYSGGADPLFEDTREGFRLTLPLTLLTAKVPDTSKTDTGAQSGLVTGQVGEQVSEQVGEQVGEQVSEQVRAMLRAAERAPRSKQELLEAAGLASVYLNYKRHVLPLLEQKLIARTIPEKPNSRLQKYRLTEKGKSLISHE